MAARSILFVLAAALYLAACGCVVWPDESPPPGPATPSPPRRVVAHGPTWRGCPTAARPCRSRTSTGSKITRSRSTASPPIGADTVELVVSARQENGTSARIFLDMRLTPTPEQLAELIHHAQEKKLRVVLMPIVLLEAPRGNEWRGTDQAGRRGRSGSTATARWNTTTPTIAEANHVDLLVVGSELVSTESHEAGVGQDDQGHPRAVSRASSPTPPTGTTTPRSPFWNKLDLIGMNSYWKLGENNKVPVEEIQARWRDIQKDLIAFSNKQGKPIILLEVGWCSLANAAHEPWDYTKSDEALDLEIQRKLYEGFFRSWYGNPNLGGFMIWEWALGDVAADDKGYSPTSKPAEKVLARMARQGAVGSEVRSALPGRPLPGQWLSGVIRTGGFVHLQQRLASGNWH